ncbi:MAG TPA: AMP-binding protein [Candidatus Cryptobacteroides merdipullorum]|uniref:AMP-binding protein n=1 Tax=Candidatus Cryptobacteroides merdipullorum TaxID=2840771 RepID=A0A9D1GPT1_9BACT|nr:AMP-binding protein [Candidatus Cryptobacteroides merdipullorum]
MKHYLATLESSMKAGWDRPALCNYHGEVFTNADLAAEIVKFDLVFSALGIKKGDKIALCAKNVARWAVSFLSVNAYEAVIVPILADFHPDSINRLVDHSDSVLLFTDKEIWDRLDISRMPKLRGAVNIDDFSVLYAAKPEFKELMASRDGLYARKYPEGISKEEFAFKSTDNFDDLAVINYTSGTTSDPKGVMLTYGNLSASIQFGHDNIKIFPGDTIVSMLPMAHVYGMAYEFLYPLSGGCAVYYLGKTPAPSLLLKAMQEVRPYMVCTVPLVMEKIYKASLKPVLSRPAMKLLTAIPGVNRIIFNKVREKLDAAFGGKVRNYIMGGAALNPEVEKCFKRIGLHYTVGYGMTEAAPLLAYEDWRRYVPGSCGKGITCVKVRIDSEDPENIAGEIQAKGDNIMKGYYKNEEATAAAFTDDGYLRTGDLGIMDAEGNIFIKGRSKSMILSANGQNIYPEELEAVVNNQNYVSESVVVDRAGKIVALVYFDGDAIRKDALDDEAVSDLPEKVRLASNRQLPAYSQIAKVEVVTVPFEKTPKMSIKRFLYK